MSFEYDFVQDLKVLGHRRIVREDFPPQVPTYSREALMSMSMLYGQTGAGKTTGLIYWWLEKYHLRVPEFGIDGYKLIGIDALGKGEMCCLFHPMDETHPLFPLCQEIGFHPESYPVEILRPLVYVRGKPDLLYEQPDIVKPFTLALSELSLDEWCALFPNGLSPGQMNLHDKALKELRKEIESVTMYDLYAKVQEIIERGDVGYGAHIEGMEEVPTITMSKKVFGAREAQGLLQKYQVVMDTGLICPQQFNGKRVETNLDLQNLLEDQRTISVFYLPQYKDLPHLNMGILNYVLNHLLYLKSPNNPTRVQTPVCIAIPELRSTCPKHVPEQSRYYVEPVKNTLLNMVSLGAGVGINLIADTQFFEQIPDEYRANVTTSFVFNLGEEASEKIKEVVKGRFVSNFKEITDDYHLSTLNEPGTFIYLGYGSTRAQIRRNMLVGFWYPRARYGESETETNYYDLFKENYSEKMRSIFPLYAKLLQINRESQRKASERMNEVLQAKKVEKIKKVEEKEQKVKEFDIQTLQGLLQICEAHNTTFLDYKTVSEELSQKINRSIVQTQRILKKHAQDGFLYIDKTQGFKSQKVAIYKEKIEEYLKGV